MLQNILNYLKDILLRSNLNGLPIPLIRDPKNSRGDVALTLVIISAIYIQIGFIASLFGNTTFSSSSAFEWFLACAGLYWARKISVKGQEIINNGSNDDKTKE